MKKSKKIGIVILMIFIILFSIFRINQLIDNCDREKGHTCSIYELHN